MEKNIEKNFTEITSKIKKLKGRNLRLESENEGLRKSVFDYLQQLENLKKEKEQLLLSKHHEQISDSLSIDKKTMTKEIDKYILMIDKCIAAIQTKM